MWRKNKNKRNQALAEAYSNAISMHLHPHCNNARQYQSYTDMNNFNPSVGKYVVMPK